MWLVSEVEVGLNENDFEVGRKSLLLDLGIGRTKVVIKVDFC